MSDPTDPRTADAVDVLQALATRDGGAETPEEALAWCVEQGYMSSTGKPFDSEDAFRITPEGAEAVERFSSLDGVPLDEYGSTPYGLADDYVRWAQGHEGIAQEVHVVSRWQGAGTVLVVLLDIPSPEIANGQAAEARGIVRGVIERIEQHAPVGAVVTVAFGIRAPR